MKQKLLWFFNSFIWLAILLLAIDLTTKLVVAANRDYILAQSEQGIILIKGFLAINYVENPNAAFSMGFSNEAVNHVLYIIVALIGAFLIIGYYVWKYKKLNRFVKACLMMMAVGAIGNLIDRCFFGFSHFRVVDWINFYGIWGFNFNIADSSIVVGTIMLIVYLIVSEVKENRQKEALEEAENKEENDKPQE